MAEQLIPAVIVTPGEILKAELDARGLSQKDLALIMDRPEQMISEIINARKQITPETAIELEQALGISAQFWVNLEANYQLHLAQERERDEAIARRRRLFELLPLKMMARHGWLELPQDAKEVERAVERFLGMNPLDQKPALAARFRHSTVKDADNLATLAWLRRVEHLAGQRQVPPFDRRALWHGMPELLECAARAEDVARVSSVLASFGVCLVILRHLDKTYLDGAACFVAGRGVAALTLRYDRIDSFWFTLLHEIAHLLEDDAHCYLDTLLSPSKENAAAEPMELAPEEKLANLKARDWLVAPGALADFVAETAPYFGQEHIEAFAAAMGRHPGIVLGRLMREGEVKYSHLRGLLVKVSPYLEGQIDA